jgi:CRP-like cAMP-binding protein
MNESIKYRRVLRKVVENYNLSRKKIEINMEEFSNITLEDKIDKFEKHALFTNFTDEEIKILAEMSELKVYNENDIIFRNNDNKLYAFAVVRGCVRIVKCNSKGEEIILANICSNSIIGETSLLKDEFSSTGVADEFVVLMRISKEKLEKLIEDNPVIGNKVMTLFLERMYMKLHDTNQLYQERVMKEEHFED